MSIAIIVLGAIVVVLLVFTLIREGQYQRLTRDLTAKILARDLGEYKEVAEYLPLKPKQVKKKKDKLNDPILGEHY